MSSAFIVKMLAAICFNGNMQFRRIEVQNIVVDRKLSFEFNTSQSSIA
jgi:hypothetical protein